MAEHVSTEEPSAKRRRVFRACDPCRAMKSKCNGARPVCARCAGYGHRCVYSQPAKKGQKPALQAEPREEEEEEEATDLCQGTAAWKALLHDYDLLVRDALSADLVRDRTELAARRASLATRVSIEEKKDPQERRPLMTPTPSTRRTPAPAPAPVERYLGAVSDVRFFRLVDCLLQEKSPSEASHRDALDSYEQDEANPHEAAPVRMRRPPVVQPAPKTAERYLGIYFSTIHIAYPFIPRALFMRTYRQYIAGQEVDDIWLATLYSLFAIGAYYTAVSGGTGDTRHEQYAQQALALSHAENLERSGRQVSCLLAHCFYLLAVCRTDRCWTTLGLAVRVAQSVGLHVDDPAERLSWQQAEQRRRLWYAVYVLDRLLALQLGRPPAIHDEDSHVTLPSRLRDSDIPWGETTEAETTEAETTEGDYFVAMVALSRIIGHVLRDLSTTTTTTTTTTTNLTSTRTLDDELLAWKRRLPRGLRFDLGHAFETSLALKRQRNMLAIKFHHLRALIHRPYLCLPRLRRRDEGDEGDASASAYERTCVAEAQHTARLLHGVVDKADLVHDFPWWQMISCLICASSILVVASVFSAASNPLDPDHVAALEDDADTCLKVFAALGAHSDGARVAHSMMHRLQTQGRRWRETHPPSAASPPPPQPSLDASDLYACSPSAQQWPLEVLDSMTWSAQFFDAVPTDASPFL